LERKRALKLLRADLERLDEAVARLRDEGRLLALLEHPAIVQVEDIVRIQGRVGLVMEYVEGTDLRQLLKAKVQLPPSVVLELIATVADALGSAVDLPSPTTGRPLRLVHRDIKPGNIMVSRHGRIKLLDFGVARSHEVSRDTQTRVGEVPMTPGFGAPEVLIHLVQEPPGDIYALGAVFFQVLTGEPLFKDIKLTQQVALVVAPRAYHDWLAGRLEGISHRGIRDLVGDMLAWNVGERPPAHLVRERAERLQAQIQGPTLARWVRGVELPSPPAIPDLPLVGQTVFEEEGPGELQRERSASPMTTRQRGSAPTPATPSARPPGPAGGMAAVHAAIQDPSPSAGHVPLRIGSTLVSDDTLNGDVDTLRPRPVSAPDSSVTSSGVSRWRLGLVVAVLGVGALGIGAVALAVMGIGLWWWAA
jgi:serine/threonine-protein kinase